MCLVWCQREVFRLQREVLQEKTKVKALSEELENPMNIHRYGTAADRWAWLEANEWIRAHA